MIRAGIVRRTRSRAWSAVDGIGKGTGVVASRRIRAIAQTPRRREAGSVFVCRRARGCARSQRRAAPRRAREREPSSKDATIRIRRGERGSERESPERERRAACNASRRISSTNPGSNPFFTSARPRVVSCVAGLDRSSVYERRQHVVSSRPADNTGGAQHQLPWLLRCLVWWHSMMLFCCRVTDDPPPDACGAASVFVSSRGDERVGEYERSLASPSTRPLGEPDSEKFPRVIPRVVPEPALYNGVEATDSRHLPLSSQDKRMSPRRATARRDDGTHRESGWAARKNTRRSWAGFARRI